MKPCDGSATSWLTIFVSCRQLQIFLSEMLEGVQFEVVIRHGEEIKAIFPCLQMLVVSYSFSLFRLFRGTV